MTCERSSLRRLILVLLLLSPVWCVAQTMPIVMLSDLHFDPLRDPAKGARLAAAPESEWAAILEEPATPTQVADFAAIQAKCGLRRGIDSDFALMSSALHAAHAASADARFVTVSGDLVVHNFDCRWKLVTGHDKGYEDFHEKAASFAMRQVQAAFPGVPVYVALGNNDSSCGDYRMDLDDRYLKATSAAAMEGLVGASKQERQEAEVDYRKGGYFSVALPGLTRTRLLVVDDLYLSRNYRTCAGREDTSEEKAVLRWLQRQLEQAKKQGEAVWVMSHIPPGVDVYSTTVKFRDVCAGDNPVQFLADDALGTLLSEYPETVRLAIFGHTHSDEVRLLGAVPAKVVGSVTPINGNVPSFTVGEVSTKSSALVDYRVLVAANRSGGGPWTEEYSYDRQFGAEAFSGATVRAQIAAFRKDRDGIEPMSEKYQQDFFPGGTSPLGLVWPQAVCALGNFTAAEYRGCLCGGGAP